MKWILPGCDSFIPTTQRTCAGRCNALRKDCTIGQLQMALTIGGREETLEPTPYCLPRQTMKRRFMQITNHRATALYVWLGPRGIAVVVCRPY